MRRNIRKVDGKREDKYGSGLGMKREIRRWMRKEEGNKEVH